MDEHKEGRLNKRAKLLSSVTENQVKALKHFRRTAKSISAITAVIAILLAPIAGAAQRSAPRRTGPSSRGSAAYTAEETDHFRYVYENTKKRVLYELNVAEPHQYGYVQALLKHGGATPQTNPELFRRLNAAHANGVAGPPKAVAEATQDCPAGDACLTAVNLLEYATVDSKGKNLVSSMLSSYPGGTQSTSMQLNYRVGSAAPFAASPIYFQYAQGTNFSQAYSAGIPAGVSAGDVIASALFTINAEHYYSYSDDDAPIKATSVCSTAPNYGKEQPPTTPCPPVGSACVNDGNILTNIISCYGRSGMDCNYDWGGPGYPDQIPLTISGSIIFPKPLVLSKGAPTGTYVLDIYFPAGHNGGGCYLYPNGKQGGNITAANFSVSPANLNQLNFCFQGASFTNKSCLKGTNPITYVDLTVNPYLDVTSGSNYGLGKVSSNVDLYSGQSWFALIPKIQMYQGCFAPGTNILMADGSWKEIETFKGDGSEQVTSGDGKKRNVVSLVTGVEKNPLYKITDSKGRSVFLTEMHAVPTTAGVKLAFQLKAGDVVNAQGGRSRLKSVEKLPPSGKVYNLALGDQRDAQKGLTTLIAEGIVVGDADMQQYFALRAKTKGFSRADTLKRLDKAWRQDYLNSLTHK